MLFNSFDFLFFLIVVVSLFWIVPRKWRWLLLLAASYYFYMAWKAEYAILLVTSTLVDFTAGQQIEKSNRKTHKKAWVALSVLVNLGILGYFKYANFFMENIQALADQIGVNLSYTSLNVILPMGISFYTFQTMAYTIDVYRNKVKAEKHLGYFALYVTYFPQLVAGPIERAGNLLDQFKQKVYFDAERIGQGIRQIIWGLFKKVVIADRIAVYVDQAYGNVDGSSGSMLLISTYLFAFQIYCDFSGYSDIAIGTSRIFGIRLMDNFRVPYLSASISEFWSRWHISLSTWFRDYLYIPLGGNRVQTPRWLFNLLIVFVISGLWHGAAWTFIIWGAIHGGILVLENFKNKLNFSSPIKLPRWVKIFWIFNIVVFAWLFFRAESLGDATLVIEKIVTDVSFNGLVQAVDVFDGYKFVFLMVVVAAFVVFDPWIDSRIIKGHQNLRAWQYHLLFGFILAVTVIMGSAGETQFIYFQF